MIGIGMAMRLNATKQTPTQRAINILTSSGPGAWYDPSDLATLFQDSAGTTPVTAVEQPVGRILDKSGGGNHLIQPTATSRPTLKQDENGLYHLHFDGVDDSLYSAASIDFTSTDKMTVFAGLHKASDTGVGTVVELSADASVNDGAFSYWNNGAAPGADAAAFRGSVVVSPTAALPAPDTKVVSLVGDIAADTALIRHNGVQVGSSVADQGTGNFGNYPLYIGRRNNASLPFNGRLYPLAIKGKALSAGEITTVEAFVKTKTGAYDPTLQALLTEAGNELATESDLYIEME
jgi:hypothetical protein